MEFLSSWVVFAFGFSFLAAGLKLTNEYFKVNGHALVFWRGLLPAICMIPVAIIAPWPTDPLFYLATIATVPVVTFTDSLHFESHRKFGAGVSSRLAPLGIITVFIIWIIANPEQIYSYINNALYGSGIILSLLLIMFFASRLRHCEISKSAFIFLLPVILFSGIATMLNKVAMDNSDLHQGVWFYILIQGFGISILAIIRDKIKKRSLDSLFNKNLIKPGLVICFIAIVGITLKGYSLRAVDNPAYFTAVSMLAPFWIIIVYKIVGRKEQGVDVTSGLFLVLSVIALVLFKGML